MKNPFNVRFSPLFYPFALGCLCLLGSFGSCERDPEPRPAPLPACRATRWDDPADSAGRVLYAYDAKKRLVALHHEAGGNAFSFWTFTYDERNQLTGKTFAARRDSPITRTVTYRYNAQGQMTGWVVMENGRYTEVTRELDAEGNCTRLTVVDTDRNRGVSITSQHAYQFQDGNLVGSVTHAGTDAERHHTYQYYPDQENKLRSHHDLVGTFAEVGPGTSRNLVRTAASVGTKHPEADAHTRQYTYEYNAKGFPTRIHSVSTHAGITSASDAVIEYDCE